ncbi:MAG TPA: NigD-like C-terminal domain-containing protein [Candidatus Egerieousia sp.]|nr:NigD-like C-terminal domain-containing protein [Candidatus Egerieousia sp.]HPT06445.1 NigD-like C-terminal domain-containing protein [Candidatus Egerieousia sp.]
MKITKILSLAVMLVAGIIFTGCSWNDNNNDGGNNLALVTIRVNTDKSVWGLTDDNKKIYFNPSSTVLSKYTAVAGQRAIVYFNILSAAVSGYDYNAQVTAIEDVLTKNVTAVSTAEQDTLGTDGIKIVNAWIAGGFLNMQVQMYYSGTAQHLISLEDNQYNPLDAEQKTDYVCLELRHNARKDGRQTGTLATGYVCFRLSDYDPDNQGKSGIYLRYTPLDSEEYSYLTIKPTTSSVVKGGAFANVSWSLAK